MSSPYLIQIISLEFFPQPNSVFLCSLEQNYTMATIWNVYGKIDGYEETDRVVLLGAHRDAWTFGSIDPISGTASVVETARGLTTLFMSGKWAPRRSIIFCSWDAEEYGLIGSMEYTELHEKTLMQRAVAYFNFDVAVAGIDLFEPLGIPSMWSALVDSAKQVAVPGNASRTVYDMWMASNVDSRGRPVLPAPGAGSDFAGFIQRLGIPVCHLQFGSALEKSGQGPYGAAYHSNMDSYYWVSHFDDKSFEFHAALARVMAVMVTRFTDDQILPFNWTDYSVALQDGVSALTAHANRTNPNQNTVELFAPLADSVHGFAHAAKKMDEQIQKALKEQISGVGARAINDRLMLAERAFIDFNGLNERQMLRNVVWAPGQFDSYAGELFPSISDAITLGLWGTIPSICATSVNHRSNSFFTCR
jgi:N-acetylated-alpha-linked acidic dipeptidase